MLEIQNTLVDSYGDEVNGIDLVNGKYKEQLELLKQTSKEKAQEFTRENLFAVTGDGGAKEQLEKLRLYDFGSVASYQGNEISSSDKKIIDFIKGYYDTRIKTLDRIAWYLHPPTWSLQPMTQTQHRIHLQVEATAEDAETVMSQFFDDLEAYGKQNNIDVSPVLTNISAQLKNMFTEELQGFRNLYDEYMQAEVLGNDSLRPLYENAITVVDDYNKALASGVGVDQAKKKLDELKQKVSDTTSSMADSEGLNKVFEGVYSAIDTATEKLVKFNNVLEQRKSTFDVYAEKLRGLDVVDIKALNVESGLSQQEQAFRSLLNFVGLTIDDVSLLTDKLVELGIVIDKTADNDTKPLVDFYSEWNALAKDTQEKLQKLAISGELSPETIKSTKEYKEWIDLIGISAEEASEKIKEFTFANLESEYDNLNNVITKIRDNQSLTASEIAKLIMQYDSLAGKILKTSDGYSIEESAILSLINTNKTYMNQMVSAQIVATETTLATIKERIEWYKNEIEAAKERGEITLALSYLVGIDQYEEEYQKTKDILDGLREQIKILETDTKTSTSSFSKEIDWLSQSITAMESNVDRLQNTLSHTNGYQAQLKAIDSVIEAQEKLSDAYDTESQTYGKRYKNRLNDLSGLGYSDEMIRNVEAKINGLSLTDLQSVSTNTLFEQFVGDKDANNEKAYEVISDAISFAEKKMSADDKKFKIQYEIEAGTKQKIEINLDHYKNIIEAYEQNKSGVQRSINEIESRGVTVSSTKYDSLIQYSKQLQEQYTKELQYLNDQLAYTDKESDAYETVQSAIEECKEAISGCIVEQAELNTKITSGTVSAYDELHNSISRTLDDLENVKTLMGDVKLYDDDGNLTSSGITQLGILGQQLANAKDNMNVYLAQLSSIDTMHRQGQYNSEEEYKRARRKAEELYKDAVMSARQYEDAIVDVNKQGLEKQIELVRELTDAKKAELDAEQELYEYQKSISERTNSINTLQKQISSLSRSTDRRDIAQRLKLEQQLAETQNELSNLQRSHSVEERKKALDEEATAQEDALQAQIDDLDSNLQERNKAVKSSLEVAKDNYDSIYLEIAEIVDNYSLTIESSVTSPWKSAVEAVNLYKAAVNEIGDTMGKINGASISSVLKPSGVSGSEAATAGTKVNRFIQESGFKKLSWNEMAKLYGDLGLGQTSASEIQNSAILRNEILEELKKRLKLASFSKGGLVDLIHMSGEDGIALVKNREAILTEAQSAAFMKIADHLPNIASQIKAPDFSNVLQNRQETVSINSPLVSVNLSGITRDEINKDTQEAIKRIPDDLMRTLRKHGVGLR